MFSKPYVISVLIHGLFEVYLLIYKIYYFIFIVDL